MLQRFQRYQRTLSYLLGGGSYLIPQPILAYQSLPVPRDTWAGERGQVFQARYPGSPMACGSFIYITRAVIFHNFRADLAVSHQFLEDQVDSWVEWEYFTKVYQLDIFTYTLLSWTVFLWHGLYGKADIKSTSLTFKQNPVREHGKLKTQ